MNAATRLFCDNSNQGNGILQSKSDTQASLRNPLLRRNCVEVKGCGKQAMIVVHGLGCDQHMRRFVTPAFLNEFTVIRYDLTGSGRSDLSTQNRNTQHSPLDVMNAIGLCPHLSAPDATIAAKRKYLTAAQRTLATQ